MSSVIVEETACGPKVRFTLDGTAHKLTPVQARELARGIMSAMARHDGQKFLSRHRMNSKFGSAPGARQVRAVSAVDSGSGVPGAVTGGR